MSEINHQIQKNISLLCRLFEKYDTSTRVMEEILAYQNQQPNSLQRNYYGTPFEFRIKINGRQLMKTISNIYFGQRKVL